MIYVHPGSQYAQVPFPRVPSNLPLEQWSAAQLLEEIARRKLDKTGCIERRELIDLLRRVRVLQHLHFPFELGNATSAESGTCRHEVEA
jgi:hypothetical protein